MESFLRRRPKLALGIRILIATGLLLGFMAIPLAFATAIRPPAEVADPVEVYLLDHGRTPSLVLPIGDREMVRYAYGDWNYYALRNKSLWDGVLALFWPTQATLGRKQFAAHDVESMLSAIDVYTERVYVLPVERRQAADLVRRLDAQFTARQSEAVINDPADLVFVPHRDRYTYFHNSNHRTRKWLSDIGCRTRGPAFYSSWELPDGGRALRTTLDGVTVERAMSGARQTTWSQTLAGQQVPLSLKIAFTAMVLLIVPIYWHRYGPMNFLWFSDVALVGTAIALWIESPLLAGMMLVGTALPEIAWEIDFWVQLLTPWRPLGITDYMFDSSRSLFIRLLSLFHVPLLICMMWRVWRLGYDRHSFPAMLALGWAVLTASYFWTDPSENINWVFGLTNPPQQWMSRELYFALVMVAFPLLIWLPTHLLLRWLVPPAEQVMR